MDDDLCKRCGWVLGTSVAACPACGERVAGRPSGYDTILVQDTPAAVAAGDSGSLHSRTTLTRANGGGRTAADLELKLKALLIRRGGSCSGQRLEVACPATTVGRQGGEIDIDDPTLSALHFRIEERGGEFFLRDLGSTNGTFLNGHLIRSAPLKSGDEIKAGESVFAFSVLEVIPCD